MRVRQRTWWGSALATLAVAGCVSMETGTTTQQEDRGLGIVHGTLGARLELSVEPRRPPGALSMTGQVVGLEGAAYLVRDGAGEEVRVPHDENTRIDRPAHIGDRILVLFDGAGRAERIWNVDHRDDVP